MVDHQAPEALRVLGQAAGGFEVAVIERHRVIAEVDERDFGAGFSAQPPAAMWTSFLLKEPVRVLARECEDFHGKRCGGGVVIGRGGGDSWPRSCCSGRATGRLPRRSASRGCRAARSRCPDRPVYDHGEIDGLGERQFARWARGGERGLGRGRARGWSGVATAAG